MTYTGAMVLPKNAVVMPEQEMRYVEGGASWSTTISAKYGKNTVKFKITVANVQDTVLSLLGLAISYYGLKSSLAALAGSVATGQIGVARLSAAGIIISTVGIWSSASTLAKNISIKKK